MAFIMEAKCNCAYYPTVVVPGIGNCRAYEVDKEGNRLRMAWPPDIDKEAAKKLKNSLILPGLRMFILRRDSGFSKKAGKAVAEVLDIMASTPDGKYKHNVKVETFDGSVAECTEEEKGFIYRMLPLKPLAELIGEDHLFYFSFVAIGNTAETAERLREYIKTVKEKTGHDKVNIAAVSLGATITSAYLDKYAADGDVNRVVGVVPAFDGSAVVSDILKGNIAYEDYEILFNELLGRKTAEKIIKAVKLLPKNVLKKFIEAVIAAVVETVILNSTTMWGIVPAAEYKALSDKYLSGSEQNKIREEADRWRRVRSDFPALVKKARDNGTGIFVLCGYNRPLFKAVNSSTLHSDMVVHSASASLGAHFAPLGESFPSDYRQQNLHCTDPAHNHINEQRDADASVGAAPDTTWFWRDMEHEQAAENEHLLTLMKLLLADDSIKDVFQREEFPQFNIFKK